MSETISVSSLREQLMPAIARAIAVLDQAVSGQGEIENDFQLRACMQLVRLAPFVLAQSKSTTAAEPDEEMIDLPPDLPLAEVERLLANLEADRKPNSNQ
jgi:hypothetical protein